MPQIPSKEAIEYGRRVIKQKLDRLENVAKDEKNHPDLRQRFRYLASMIRLQLYGYEENSGCVILPFDERWLDDDFRKMMQGVYDTLDD